MSCRGKLINYWNDRYYLEPMERDCPLQCIVKREGAERLQIYEASTLKNFMSVVKDREGYTLVSNHERQSMLNLIGSKQQIVVAKLLSNFFSNQFTCYLCETLYKKNEVYAVQPAQSPQAIHIDYETSLFGLAGPRKITAFIPAQEGVSIAGSRHFGEVYEKERREKSGCTVVKFRSRVPEWNREADSYALNFGCRPTVSSIKNFILLADSDANNGPEAVSFCKFGKDLFNLEIRHPFNILQAVSLAVSSLDRKIA